MKRPAIVLLAFALALSSCNSTGPSSASAVRMVHAVADGPQLTMDINGTPAAVGMLYGQDSPYFTVQAGPTQLTVRVTGTTLVVVPGGATLAPNQLYSFFVVGPFASVSPFIVADDTTRPASGNIAFRFIHAAPSAGNNLDVYIQPPGADLTTAQPTIGDATFLSSSPYTPFPLADYVLSVTAAGSKTVLLSSGTLTLPNQGARTLIALDAPGGGLPLTSILINP